MDISTEVAAIQAASQGSELRQPLVGALNKLNTGSLPAVTASDVGKILKVGANGWEVGEKSGYMPVPTAIKQITENGTHDVTDYASAVVNVSGGGGLVLIPKTITQNGTYDPANDNADGYSSVIVNVNNGKLPSGYTRLSHVKCNGNAYFNSGLLTIPKLGFIYRFKPSSKTYMNLFGGVSSSGTYAWLNTTSTNIVVHYNSSDYNNIISNNTSILQANVFSDNDSIKYWGDDINSGISNVSSFESDCPLFIGTFSDYIDGQYVPRTVQTFNGSIFEIAFFNASQCISHLIPCINTNNITGFYDLIREQFYRSEGSSDFIAGNIVPEYG